MDIKEYLVQKENEINKELENVKFIRSLLEKYPDLQRHVNRWKQERFTSALVVATDCEIGHNCGCCSDSPVEVWPYALEGQTRIYVTGIPFIVGEKNSYEYGETPYDGWEDKLRKANLSEEIITKVGHFLGVKGENEWEQDA